MADTRRDAGKRWHEAMTKRERDEHDALRVCILLYGRKLRDYTLDNGTEASVWLYHGAEYHFSKSREPRP